MRLVLSWLREFVDVRAPASEIADTLDMRGFEVASVDALPGGDAVMDFEIAANRPDCLSVVGLAREVANEGIRVNAVRPGLIDTEIHASGGDAGRLERLRPSVPMQRIGSAEEVANAVVWLISDEASYVTGTIFDVSGGR